MVPGFRTISETTQELRRPPVRRSSLYVDLVYLGRGHFSRRQVIGCSLPLERKAALSPWKILHPAPSAVGGIRKIVKHLRYVYITYSCVDVTDMIDMIDLIDSIVHKTRLSSECPQCFNEQE